ncbi:DUF3105 domain-containing protein [Streptomyces sp. XM83C]|jgi:hypothetical protein|uniref:DUF3105 domain-containing protein n=1 Tax=Streptomyces thermocoprophilus TaxID=78356 RepID=A0ABV5VK88_9ACTN|nr:DUF3105 domain-containing protein [Streptomyces sp. XM83C]MCK1821028.1 DUF3105 domain-containing protein [Streptomyces sp. XM83C]
MGSGNTSSSAARKARIEEMRRAEQARERRNRVLVIGGSVVAVAALVVGAVFVVKSQSGSDDSSASGSAKNASGHWVTGSDGVKTWEGDLSRNHTGSSVSYPMQPPVGGDHNPVWADCNGTVYTKPVKNENAVHSLEHGAVWVTYTDKAAKADVEALAAKVKKTPYTLMSPYEKQDAPIVLSAWGHQRTVTGASDPAVDQFFQTYVQGKQTPEPGASCTGGTMQ